jgi:hypothetical protein
MCRPFRDGLVRPERPYRFIQREIIMNMNANDPRFNFEANPTLDELIAQQGKGPVVDTQILHGDFWPENEPIEDFLVALRAWRGHGDASKSDPAA